MEWNHSLLSHLWDITLANECHLALPTMLFMSRPHVTNQMPFAGPRVCVLSYNACLYHAGAWLYFHQRTATP